MIPLANNGWFIEKILLIMKVGGKNMIVNCENGMNMEIYLAVGGIPIMDG